MFTGSKYPIKHQQVNFDKCFTSRYPLVHKDLFYLKVIPVSFASYKIIESIKMECFSLPWARNFSGQTVLVTVFVLVEASVRSPRNYLFLSTKILYTGWSYPTKTFTLLKKITGTRGVQRHPLSDGDSRLCEPISQSVKREFASPLRGKFYLSHKTSSQTIRKFSYQPQMFTQA